MHGHLNIKFSVAITEMYPRIPWELDMDPLGSAEHTLRTTVFNGTVLHLYI